MENCEICPFALSQEPDTPEVLLQTEYWNVVLDRNQEYLGKAFVSARRHVETLPGLTADEWANMHEIIERYDRAAKQAFGADVLNWMCLMNNAVAAGQPTHVHWHVHPRYLGGTQFAGEEFPDPQWPRRVEKMPNMVDDELFLKIGDALREGTAS